MRDTGERWALIEPAELVRLRARIAAVMRRIDAAERAARDPDEGGGGGGSGTALAWRGIL